MNCRKCDTPYELTSSLYQMESRNRLFCFEDVPALKCPECEHLFLPESTVNIILEQIAVLSQGSPIPYIKYKWNKKTNIQTPDEVADELLKKGSGSDSDEFDDEAGLEPEPPMEAHQESQAAPEEEQPQTRKSGPEAVPPLTRLAATAVTPAKEVSASASRSAGSDETEATTISATRTKGVVVRKRTRVRAGNAA